ncbi:hypothetical protein EDC04DRAFT_2977959 [Pisolithus marmoratus]|nr:hypothetical protein EDC04DRAFT_2977959 [Pisolithus marmoratus]
MAEMHQEDTDCTSLMECTADVLNDEGLQRLLISTQQSSIGICVKYAVNLTLRHYMMLGFKDRLQVDVKILEANLLSWFPNCGGVSNVMAYWFSCTHLPSAWWLHVSGSVLNALTCTVHVGGMAVYGSVLNALTCTPHVGGMTASGSVLNALTCTLHVGGMAEVSDLMACLAGPVLNALTCTLHVGGMTGTTGSVLNALTCILHVGGMTATGSVLSDLPCTPHIGGMTGSGSVLNALTYTLHDVLSKFDVDANIPMPPLPQDVTVLGKFPTVQSLAEHAIGMAWAICVEEGFVIATISKAVKAVFCAYDGNMNGLCPAIVKVIMENCMSDPCQIRLSDIGKRYHSFPKGTFKARFIPPSAPCFVVKHLAAHPPSWTWTTKGGPNKDRSFQVPTIPITCDKAAPRAIHWVVAVFHSFKAHLNPIAIDGETGKVKPGWLRLYQNNLYVHLRGQMKETAVPKQAPPLTPKPSSTSPPSGHPKPTPPRENLLEAELSKLCQEMAELRDKFHNYITSHEACCMRCSNSLSESSEEEHTTRVTPCPPPVLLTLLPDGSSKPIANPPTWLVAALAQQDLPITFRDSIFVPSPFTPSTLVPGGNSRSTHKDGDLRISTVAPAGAVTTTYNLPHDPYTSSGGSQAPVG